MLNLRDDDGGGRREGGREREREISMDIDGCGRIWKVMDGYGWR